MKTTKQTAVGWLRDKINSNLITPMSPKFEDMFEQAEQMFEEQIKEAHKTGIEFITSTKINDTEYSEKFFKETFKK
jgi:hypothetical protein